jgi:hypothetical protein
LWHSGRIDSTPELGLDCFDGFVAEMVKGRMTSIGDVAEPIVDTVHLSG